MEPMDFYRHLRPIQRYVDSHIDEQITLTIVAKQIGLSNSHFSRIFHQHTGICFQHWLNEVRVAKAKELLLAKDTLITQIAFEVGFGSLSAFERAFKKLEGSTPLSFRRSARGKIDPAAQQTPIS